MVAVNQEWYCKTMGIEFGPMSFDDLAGLIERGNLRAVDPVRQGPTGLWLKADEVPELAVRLGKRTSAAASEKVPTPPSQPGSPRGTSPPDPLGWEATVGRYELEPLDRYNCAILIGADGVTVCDLREALPVALKGARVIGHRSPDDNSPVRCGPLEVQLSIRQIEVADDKPRQAASTVEEPPEAASAEPDAEFEVETVRPKPAARRAPKQSETSDVAAEMLRRMFLPQPSKGR
ncbi:MAG TPA: DUF4339 domain-containing protein [Pirellulales bacterium]|nr:DUF4339 domain-containing protein [Pirellulales bacterium]